MPQMKEKKEANLKAERFLAKDSGKTTVRENKMAQKI